MKVTLEFGDATDDKIVISNVLNIKVEENDQ